jgi:hypothetical protein
MCGKSGKDLLSMMLYQVGGCPIVDRWLARVSGGNRRVVRVSIDALEHRPYAIHTHIQVKRFKKIFIDPEIFQLENDGFLTGRGQHCHRKLLPLRIGTDLPQNGDSILSRHEHIKKNNIEGIAPEAPERFRPTARFPDDTVKNVDEDTPQDKSRRRVVVNDQDACLIMIRAQL